MLRPTTYCLLRHCLSRLQFSGLAFVMAMLTACSPADDGVQHDTITLRTTAAQNTSALEGTCAPEPDGAVAWFTGDVNAKDMVTLVPALLSDTVSIGSAFVDGGFVFSGGGGDALKTLPLESFATTDFTAEMWVQASSTNGNNATLIYYGAQSEALRIYNPSNLSVSVGGSTWQTAALAIDDDTFHHLAVTWQGSDGELRVFLDGQQTHSTNLNPAFVLPSDGVLRLGQRLNASSLGAFTGTLDEFTIYDRVLGAAEITSIYEAGLHGKCRPDADLDGTPDDRDECADSSAEDSGDFETATGCYASQLDRELDGVCDTLLAFETTLCAPRCAPVPGGLVGWWPTDAADPALELVHGANLELTASVGHSEGKVGHALSFTGTAEDNASVASYYNFPRDAAAIELWVQIPADVPFSTLFSYASFSDSAELRVSYYGDQLRFHVNDQLFSTGVELDDGTWHHVAFTWRSEDGLGRAYVDGRLVAEDTLQPGNLLGAGGVVSIGHARPVVPGPSSQHFNGAIDEASLYNRFLTGDEIRDIFRSRQTGKCRSVAINTPLFRTGVVGTPYQNTLHARLPGLQPSWSVVGGTLPGGISLDSATGVLSGVPQSPGVFPVTFQVSRAEDGRHSEREVELNIGQCIPAPSGLVSFWPLDGHSNDVAGTNHGTAGEDVIYGPGVVSDAFYARSSTNSSILVPNHSSLNATGLQNGFTLEAWAMPSNVNGTRVIVTKGQLNSVKQYHLGQISEDWECFVRAEDNSIHRVRAGLTRLQTMQHLACTWDGSTLRLYVDAIEVGAVEAPMFRDNDSGFGIGGSNNSWAGIIDEVAVYNRALSHSEILSIYTATGGKCQPGQPLTAATFEVPDIELGQPVDFQLQAVGGEPPYAWTVVSGELPPGLSLSPTGRLTGQASVAVSSDVVVSITDASGQVVEVTYNIRVLASVLKSVIRATKWGSIPVAGREIDYVIVVTNVTASPRHSFVIVEFLDGPLSYVSSSPEATLGTDDTVSPPQTTLNWFFPEAVAPNESVVVSYRVLVDPATQVNTLIFGGGSSASSPIDKAIDESVNAFKDWYDESMEQILEDAASCDTCIGLCEHTQSICDEAWAKCTEKGFETAACSFLVSYCHHRFYPCISCNAQQNAVGLCGDDAIPPRAAPPLFKPPVPPIPDVPDNFWADNLIRLPQDPNEKGVVANRYISPAQELAYPIHFENISETVEARDVFVTDVLDVDLDLNTVSILARQQGQQTLPLFPGERVVFYENERTETIVVGGEEVTLTRLEEWSAVLDGPSRTLTFELLNIDLDPGVSDFVMFSIHPLPQLPEGTDITNTADIQFEIFETLTTNETINTIDITPPSCEVDALPETSPPGPLTLHWDGADGGSGILDYTIFMAVDDGGFEAIQRGPHTESIIADLEDGHTYRFLCLARDNAVNHEAPSDIAEATTTVSGVPPQCVPSDSCHTSMWDAANGCVEAPIECNDIDACHTAACDVVQGCVQTEITCSPTDACHVATCDIALGCVEESIACEPADACHDATCDPANGCVQTEIECGDEAPDDEAPDDEAPGDVSSGCGGCDSSASSPSLLSFCLLGLLVGWRRRRRYFRLGADRSARPETP